MRAIIIGQSPYKSFLTQYEFKKDDYIVCLDGGFLDDIPYDIDVAIGDFDTAEAPKKAKKIIKYPKEKNETDFELALMHLQERKDIDEILVYNATGGRLDHFLINVRLLEKYYPLNITIIDDKNKISFLKKGQYEIIKDSYQYISLIVINEGIISIEGFKYNLCHQLIKSFDTYTTSNELTASKGIITIETGSFLLIKTK